MCILGSVLVVCECWKDAARWRSAALPVFRYLSSTDESIMNLGDANRVQGGILVGERGMGRGGRAGSQRTIKRAWLTSN